MRRDEDRKSLYKSWREVVPTGNAWIDAEENSLILFLMSYYIIDAARDQIKKIIFKIKIRDPMYYNKILCMMTPISNLERQ